MNIVQTSSEPKFPHNERDFLGTLHRLLAARGLSHSADLLEYGTPKIEYDSYDNWNGGTDYWCIALSVPVETFAKAVPGAGGKDLDKLRETIKQCGNELLADLPADFIGSVTVTPVIGPDLREVSEINNQGRAHSQNIAGIIVDGLRFRSRGEVHLYRALRTAGVTFAPLPVFLAGTRRIEPDFVLMKDGISMVVEIDGPDTHRESPVDAERRLAMFRHEGVRTERVSADDCANEEKARSTAARLLELLARYHDLK